MPTNYFITLTKAKTVDDNIAIDAGGKYDTDELKSVCLAWHGSATGSSPGTLTPGTSVTLQPLKSVLVQRSPGRRDSHLIVSQEIFSSLRAALAANYALRLRISDQTTPVPTFQCDCINAPAVEEDTLLAIAETVTDLDERVASIEAHISAIHELLANEVQARQSLGTRPRFQADRLSSRDRNEYRSSNGAEQR